ncbi:MAG: ATPase inhibitor subunit zeta [Shimia sp.]|uniref:ATPase inhibitor subunit zeta n=1 Tax=Shimia sp. TaxID=1954381 RepID=UPI00405995C2
MSTFEDRETAFEAKFAMDEQKDFIARMRRNRFMAVWASAKKGETVEQARAFGRELVKKDLQEIGDDDVIEAVMSYLGDLTTEDHVRLKLVEMMSEAKLQMLQED